MSSPARPIFLTAAILQAGDVLTTKYALSHGAHEANGAMRGIVQVPTPLLLLFKVGLCLAAYAAWTWAEGRHVRRTGTRPHPAVYLPLLCTLSLYTYVLCNNLAVARGGA